MNDLDEIIMPPAVNKWLCWICDSPCVIKTASADFPPEFCPFDDKRKPDFVEYEEV